MLIGVRSSQILLKSPFWDDERKFSGPLMRFARDDLRGHNVSKTTTDLRIGAEACCNVEGAKNGPSREIRCRSMFDFFSSIDTFLKCRPQ
jgi:hypothetical protein